MLKKNVISYSGLSNIIYCCLILVLFNEIICLSTFADAFPDLAHLLNRIKKISNIVLIAVYIFSCFCSGGDKKKFVIFLLLILFVAVSKKTWLIFDLLFVPLLLSSFVSLNRLYRVFFYTILITSLLVFVLAHYSLIPTIEFKRNDVVRYVWGFAHPNELGFVVLSLCFLFALLKFKDNSYTTFFFLIASLLFVFYGPNSITSCFIIFLFIVCLLFVTFINTDIFLISKQKIFIFSLIVITVITGALYFVSLTKFGQQYLSSDLFVTFKQRLELSNAAMSDYGFSWFGQKIKMGYAYHHASEYSFLVIDSALFYLPIVVGVIPTLVLVAVFFYSIKKTIYSNKMVLYIIHILLFVYSISECLQVTTCLCMYALVFAFKNEEDFKLKTRTV